MFVTATAPNPLVVNLIAEATNMDIHLSWGTWALAMLLPGLVAMAIMPLVIYMMYPPEI
ncbi:DASS family sodium-coupled anion symporter [Oligella ureolytica]